MAPFARSCATTVESNGGTSIAKLTSLFDVVRMSFVSIRVLEGRRRRSTSAASRDRDCCRTARRARRRAPARRVAGGISRTPRCARGQRAGRRMRVELALAGDGALAADVQRLERVDLAGVGNAHAHADLLPGRWDPTLVGSMRPQLERQALVVVELREDGGNGHRLRREHEGLAGADVARHAGSMSAPSAVTSAVQTPL